MNLNAVSQEKVPLFRLVEMANGLFVSPPLSTNLQAAIFGQI